MLNNFNPKDPNDPNSGAGGGNNGTGGNVGSGNGGIMPNLPSSLLDANEIDPLLYLIDYNEKFKNAGPTLYRDEVVQQTLSCMIGKFKPNALLVGAAGVGKTKIVEDIAYRLANNNVLIPNQLKDYKIMELPLSRIISGGKYVGDVEKRLQAILDYLEDPTNKIILFIDEIHMLASRDEQTYGKIAQFMKPALARGKIKTIGATTLTESQRLMDDPAFNRRFSRLIVDELSREQTLEILKSMKVTMFTHYNSKIVINDDLLNEVTIVADEHKTMGSHRPDNAITLLDRAMADTLIDHHVKIQRHKNDADPTVYNALMNMQVITLSKSRLKETAMKLMTGNNRKNSLDATELSQNLSKIKGQTDIIKNITDILVRHDLNLMPTKQPLTLLFAGNSGVGKSEIAKIVADTLTGVKPIIINMGEYHDSADVNRIIGAPPGYAGYDSDTELPFDILESNPYQVILLDEFEKCHPSIQELFMSVFEEGYLTTSRNKIIDFSKSIIIATTNAGYTTNSDAIGFISDETRPKASTKDLSQFINVAIINRFSKVLTFNSISEEIYREILRDNYKRTTKQIVSTHSSMTYLPDTLPIDDENRLVKETYNKELNARPASRTIKHYIEDIVLAHKAQVAQNIQNATNNIQENNDTPSE